MLSHLVVAAAGEWWDYSKRWGGGQDDVIRGVWCVDGIADRRTSVICAERLGVSAEGSAVLGAARVTRLQ
jgi:hypothetical protein